MPTLEHAARRPWRAGPRATSDSISRSIRCSFSVLGFTVTDGLITEIDILADPDRLGQLDLSGL